MNGCSCGGTAGAVYSAERTSQATLASNYLGNNHRNIGASVITYTILGFLIN